MKTPEASKIEYLILPTDRSHVVEVLYRLCTDKTWVWGKTTLPLLKIKNLGIEAIFKEYTCFYTPVGVFSNNSKVKYYELKLVRKYAKSRNKRSGRSKA